MDLYGKIAVISFIIALADDDLSPNHFVHMLIALLIAALWPIAILWIVCDYLKDCILNVLRKL